MKKLLNILGVISLPTIGASVVACGDGKIIKQPATQKELKTSDKTPKEPKVEQPTSNKINQIEEITSLTNDKKNLEQNLKTKEKELSNITESNIKILKYKTELEQELENKENENKDLKKQIENKEKEIEQIKKSFSYEEMKRLRKQIDLQRINISKFDLTPFSPPAIYGEKDNKKNNIILATEFEIKKVLSKTILEQLKEKVDSSLTESDFSLLISNDDSFNHMGVSFVNLTSPKEIKIKIKGINRTREETDWLTINLPKATVK